MKTPPLFSGREAGLAGFTPAHRATRNTHAESEGVSRRQSRMKRFGKVDIPSEAFTVMLKRD